MKQQPKYSIIVPTCERHTLLEPTLRGLLLAEHDDYEILVSDNFSSPETKEVVLQINDPRIRYVRTEYRMALCDHWDFAFSHAGGEYFTVNGDDDGLTPGLLKRLDRILQEGFSLVTWPTALYFHPDWEHDEGGNVLQLRSTMSGKVLRLSVEDILSAYTQLNRNWFPESTRICCRRSLAEKVIRKTGRLFWPLSVDLTSSLLLLGEINESEFAFIDDYMGFGGRSKISNAAAYERCPKNGKGGDQTRAENFYKEHGDMDLWPWHPIKSKAYWNGHAAAWSLFRHWYDRSPTLELNWTEVLGRMLSENLGVSNANPFVSSHDLRIICDFIWQHQITNIKAVLNSSLNSASSTHADLLDVRCRLGVFSEAATDRPDRSDILNYHASFCEALLYRLKDLASHRSPQLHQAFSNGIKHISGSIFLKCDHLAVRNGFDLMRSFENLLMAIKSMPSYKECDKNDLPDFNELIASANARIDNEEWNEAATLLKKAATLQPENADLQSSIGLCLNRLDQDTESVVHFLRAAQLSPSYNSAMDLGDALIQTHRTKEAKIAYQQALLFQPKDALATENLAKCSQITKNQHYS